MKTWVLIIAILGSISAHALVERAMDEKRPIEVVLSRSSHNRICVECGSIEKVIGKAAIFSITLDQSTGAAFVNVLQDILKNPSTLTVITSTGVIQDLLVLSKEGPSEQIILKESDYDEEEIHWKTLPHITTVEMLNHILEGKTPFGYGQRPLFETDQLELPKGMHATSLKAFEGPFESIVVYSIQNEMQQTITITCESIKKEEHAWIFLNVHKLKPKEQALCVIAYTKKEN